MNPDTLRTLADMVHGWQAYATAHEMRQAAEAWEADIQRQNDWHRVTLDLRQRLAEISRLAGAVLEQCADTTAVVAFRAALAAGEEKPVEDDGAYWRTGWPTPAAGEEKP